jgi:hypothetical protein
MQNAWPTNCQLTRRRPPTSHPASILGANRWSETTQVWCETTMIWGEQAMGRNIQIPSIDNTCSTWTLKHLFLLYLTKYATNLTTNAYYTLRCVLYQTIMNRGPFREKKIWQIQYPHSGSVPAGVCTITDRRCMESASSANFGWLLPDRIKNIEKKIIPTRDNTTTIKDQYETKLVQFLSLTTKICVPAQDHRIENSGHIRGPKIISVSRHKEVSRPGQVKGMHTLILKVHDVYMHSINTDCWIYTAHIGLQTNSSGIIRSSLHAQHHPPSKIQDNKPTL